MLRYISVVFGLVFIAASCASAFPYKWYGLDPTQGKLLGKTEEEDLPLKVCNPDDIQKGKCVVIFVQEFDRLRSDYAEIKQRLVECEKH